MVKTYEVEFVDEGVTIDVPEHKSILDAAEEFGLQVPYRCRKGICGVCCAEREGDGSVDQTRGMFLSSSEKDDGYTLTCITTPESDLQIRTDSAP